MATTYSTRNLSKGMAIATALVEAGHHVQIQTAAASPTGTPIAIMLGTSATAAEFAAIRMGLAARFPSSNTNATIDMPDPDNITVPDTFPSDWA